MARRRRSVRDRAQVYALCFSSEAGRQVLDDLRLLYDGQTYVRGDALETAFREGQRAVYRYIRDLMASAHHPPEEDVTDV